MIIKGIKLVNIRSHAESDIPIEKGITVFTGRTGSGKSTILMAIEYALFGSESKVSNKILRRGAIKGSIELAFVERGDEYTVIRGLKRQGENIISDLNSQQILKNGAVLNLLGRSRDINSKILEILGYPLDLKPRELFEITSYARQDEIRELVSMSNEKRQEHIDRILQLSKYKNAWEKMKEIMAHFNSKLLQKKSKLDMIDSMKEELLKIEKRKLECINQKTEAETKFIIASESHKVLFTKKSSIESEIKDLLEKRRSHDILKGTIERLKKEILSNEQLEKLYMQRMSEIKEKIGLLSSEETLEQLNQKFISLMKDNELALSQKHALEKEFESIKKMGKGKCPTCLQNVNQEHIDVMKGEFESRKEEKTKDITENISKISLIQPMIEKLKSRAELEKTLERVRENLEESQKRKAASSSELVASLEKEKAISFDQSGLAEKELLLQSLSVEERKVFSEMNSASKQVSMLSQQLKELESDLSYKVAEVSKLEGSKEEITKLQNLLSLLSRMREDMRNMRELIRHTFLEEFRQEFISKFDDLRKFEEEYTVDVKMDYEPVAFAGKEEVPLSNLSGGEKTAIALSYKLALAEIAARVSQINRSEILILDEPTIGFDSDDVKALPKALQNIRTVPQIVIVTHQEELKEAADHNFEVKKERGISLTEKLR